MHKYNEKKWTEVLDTVKTEGRKIKKIRRTAMAGALLSALLIFSIFTSVLFQTDEKFEEELYEQRMVELELRMLEADVYFDDMGVIISQK